MPRNKLTPDEVQEARRLYHEGLTARQVNERMGRKLAAKSMKQLLIGASWKGLEPPPEAAGPRVRPIRSPASKMTPEKVREIRRKWAAGWTLRELCDEYGLTKCPMSHIVNRKTWRHVED